MCLLLYYNLAKEEQEKVFEKIIDFINGGTTDEKKISSDWSQ